MEILSDNEKIFNQSLNLAYRYLSYKPRTISEMTEYLKSKGIQEDMIEATIVNLVDKNFLDDHQFTLWFIENRIKFKPKSIFALEYELKKKGIKSSIIESVLSSFDDMDLALKAIHPKLIRWEKSDRKTLEKKVLNFLKYRGFSYSVCIRILDSLRTEGNNQ